MIKQNDILMFGEGLSDGTELMVAVGDEYLSSGVPKVSVMHLNSHNSKTSMNIFDVELLEVVGHAQKGESPRQLVQKYLPKEKWKYTEELFNKNNR